MAITRTFIVANHGDASDPALALTSAAFNSTGYEALVVFFKHEGAPTTITFTDNKGNNANFVNLTKVDNGNGDLSSVMGYVLAPIVGTGHTITATLGATRSYRRIGIWGINADDVVSLDHAVQTSGTSATPTAGTLNTTGASVSFMGVGEYASSLFTAGTGWTQDWDQLDASISTYGQSRADASGSFSATCTYDAGSAVWNANAASFREGTAPAGGVPKTSKLTLLGVG